jgi:hypothetical protein
VKVDITEGVQVILASGVSPGDQVVIDGQEKLLNGSKVNPRTQDSNGAGGKAAGSAPADGGQGAAAFGPGSAGPSEPSDNPHKHGIETGSGVRPGGGHGQGGPGGGGATGQGQGTDGQPHHHHGPQTGQPQ